MCALNALNQFNKNRIIKKQKHVVVGGEGKRETQMQENIVVKSNNM